LEDIDGGGQYDSRKSIYVLHLSPVPYFFPPQILLLKQVFEKKEKKEKKLTFEVCLIREARGQRSDQSKFDQGRSQQRVFESFVDSTVGNDLP
jgi:hypothetical protein